MEKLKELTELFRRSGGRFDNAALGHRAEEGFYVYSLNSDKETVVLCPAHLLIDTDDLDICEDGLFITNPEKYGTHIEFLQKYLAFHFNKKMLERYLERKRQIDSLTKPELDLISRLLSYQASLINMKDLEYAKKQIFISHRIDYFGKEVLMPFVTFLNHAKHGIPYNVMEDSISVSGKFSDEVFATYNEGDVIEFARNHGFITDTKFAYSLSMKISMPNGTEIVINRNPESSVSSMGNLLPVIHKEGNTVLVSWYPLYFQNDPQYPVKVAQYIAREAGLLPVVILNEVIRSNIGVLVTVAFQLLDSTNPYAQLLAAAAQRQLVLMGGRRS